MDAVAAGPRVVSRAGAIALLREELLKLASEEKSLCLVAAERGIFCHGFRNFSDAELRGRISSEGRRGQQLTRGEIEKLANFWMLNRQEAQELPLSCDVEKEERNLCGGWDAFGDHVLERFCRELFHFEVLIKR